MGRLVGGVHPASAAGLHDGAVRAGAVGAGDAASMLAVLGSDFIRTANAMGIARTRIIVAYALRNALLPVLTITGIVFSTMLGANVLVEKSVLLARAWRPMRWMRYWRPTTRPCRASCC